MSRSSLFSIVVALALLATPALAEVVLLVPESSNDSVQKFDVDTGAYIGELLADPDNLSTPIDTDVNEFGVLVSDQIDDAVRQYSFTGTFIGTFASPIDNLRGIAAYNGALYCTAGNEDAIPYFDLTLGTPLGNFIPPGGGGLDSPFDILFRSEGDVLVTSINSDNILRYDTSGVFLDVFATNIPFGEQMYQAANGNILVADFSRSAIIELLPDGTEFAELPVSGPRGCYELANGNILTTNGSGVHEIDRTVGGIIDTKLAGVSARYIQLVDLEPPVSVEPSTWGSIKSRFQQ
jgi:hypothetical protein